MSDPTRRALILAAVILGILLVILGIYSRINT